MYVATTLSLIKQLPSPLSSNYPLPYQATALSLINQSKSPKTHNNESFKVGCALAMELVKPQQQNRHENSNGLAKYTQRAITELLGIQIIITSCEPAIQKHCRKCLEYCVGDGQSIKKNSLLKFIHRCLSCGEALYNKRYAQDVARYKY